MDRPNRRASSGDVVLEVAGERISSLATLFRKIWQLGPAGTEIPLALARESSCFGCECIPPTAVII